MEDGGTKGIDDASDGNCDEMIELYHVTTGLSLKYSGLAMAVVAVLGSATSLSPVITTKMASSRNHLTDMMR